MDFHPVERNLREMFYALSTHRASTGLQESNGVWIASLGVAFQMFNTVFLSSPIATEQEFGERLASGSLYMEARGLPWSFWLCEDWLTEPLRRRAVQICQRHGLRLASEMPGMVTERVRSPSRSLPELDVKEVVSEGQRRDFCDIGITCFRVPRAWFEEVFDYRMRERTGFRAYVGYVREEPVATAASVTANGVIGIYNVGVLPNYQQRGYAEAAMRYTTKLAKEATGLDRVVLQSTQQAIRLYEHMGFSAATRILVFTS